MIYIYGLECPIAGVIRYVGKSINPQKRLRGHISGANNGSYRHHTSAWLRKLIAAGLEPRLVILEEVVDGRDWRQAERSWIAKESELGWRLTNSTYGGEGLDYKDPVAKAAYLKKLSAASKKAFEENPELRMKLLRSQELAWKDASRRSVRIASMTLAQNRPEVKARVTAATKAAHARPEVRAKKSLASKLAWKNQEYVEAILRHRQSEMFRRKQGSALVERWSDDEHRVKMVDARWTPEKRAEQAQRIEARRDRMLAARTPEVRARQAETLRATWARRKAQQI